LLFNITVSSGRRVMSWPSHYHFFIVISNIFTEYLYHGSYNENVTVKF